MIAAANLRRGCRFLWDGETCVVVRAKRIPANDNADPLEVEVTYRVAGVPDSELYVETMDPDTEVEQLEASNRCRSEPISAQECDDPWCGGCLGCGCCRPVPNGFATGWSRSAEASS